MKVGSKTLLAAGAGLMLSLFAVGSGQDVARESQVKKPGGFNGRWTNVEPAQAATLNTVTRLDIHSNAERTFVRMWVKCGPVDCDWGEESAAIAEADKGELALTWRRESIALTQKVSLMDNGLLRVEGQVRSVGNQSRPTESYSFLLTRSPDFKPSPGMSSAPVAVQRAVESVATLLVEDAGGRQTAVGSGVFLQPELLATSFSVIKGRAKLVARLAGSNTTLPVTETLQYDEENDLAVVKVPGAKGWPLSPSRNMLVGGIDVFVMICNSNRNEPAVSQGVISTTRQSGTENQIEITAPASPTDVGSPVLNKRGELIGLLASVEENTKAILATRASQLLALLTPRPGAPATGITRPVSLGVVRPKYTEEARNNKVSGTVVMRVLVGADGTVKQVEVIRGLPDGLTEEAVKSMRQTRFKPATKNGQPVEFWITTEASFYVR